MRIPYNTLQILFSSSDCLTGPYTGAMPGKGPYLRPLGCPVQYMGPCSIHQWIQHSQEGVKEVWGFVDFAADHREPGI